MGSRSSSCWVPLARLVYDQFARIALKSIEVRRGNVLDTFRWPTSEARSRLERLPVIGPDLFNGEFISKLSEEVKRHQETASASFAPPPKWSLRPRPASPQPFSRLRGVAGRARRGAMPRGADLPGKGAQLAGVPRHGGPREELG